MQLSVEKLFSVSGKVVLVTGGTRGIGRMIAEGFVQNGATVIITARTGVSKAAAEMKCVGVEADLSTDEGIVKVVKAVEKFGKLDVLVNNAGCNWNDPVETHNDAAFEKVLKLNLKAVFAITRELVPFLRKSNQVSGSPARIINIGSINGISPPAFATFGYAASKAGLHMLTRHLAGHLAPQITVNAVAPGSFESKMMKHTLDQFGDIIKEGVPMKRIGRPEDMASVCIWLSSRGGEYVNGSVIVVDGGALISKSKL